MTRSRDKTRPEASSGCFLQTFEAVLVVALPPLGHDLEGSIQTGRDLLVLEAFGSVKHDFGAYYVSIWCCIFPHS
jgi:hypothetical protein